MQSYASQIIRVLEKITAAGADEAQIFDDFLDMVHDSLERLPDHVKSVRKTRQLAQDPAEIGKRWDRFRSRYKSRYYFGLFAKAFSLLLASAEDDWNDTIGEVYMEFGHPGKRGGLYFTPFPLAKMMAATTTCSWLLLPKYPSGCWTGVSCVSPVRTLTRPVCRWRSSI